MLKSCKYCGKIHERGFICPLKPKQKVYDKKITPAVIFRNSKDWKQKRQEIRIRDKQLCQVCLRKLHNTKYQYNFTDIEVHHIVPIMECYKRRLDDTNLITICRYHHELAENGQITRRELWKIAREQDTKNYI